MSMIDVKIVSKEDTKPVWPDIASVPEGELERFCVLQGGMESGRSSVAFLIKLDDGTHVLVQTSAELMDMMAGAARGARMRWGEIPVT